MEFWFFPNCSIFIFQKPIGFVICQEFQKSNHFNGFIQEAEISFINIYNLSVIRYQLNFLKRKSIND